MHHFMPAGAAIPVAAVSIPVLMLIPSAGFDPETPPADAHTPARAQKSTEKAPIYAAVDIYVMFRIDGSGCR